MTPLLLGLLCFGSNLAIENVTLYVGDGTVLKGATILVRDGVIVKTGVAVPLPKTVQRIDGSGQILTPGFIESQSQLGLTEVSSVASTNDHSLEGDGLSPGFRVADGFNPHSIRIPVNRNEGVTGAIISPSSGILAGTGNYIPLTGSLDDRPTPKVPLAMFGAVNDGANNYAGKTRGGLWMTLREFFAEARLYRKHAASINRGQFRPLRFSPFQLQAMTPVLQRRIPLVLKAHRASDILDAIRFAKEEKIRLILAGASEAALVSAQLSKHKIPVIIRPSVQGPTSFESLHSTTALATRLHEAGVPLIISAGGWAQNARRLRQEAGIAVALGLPYQVALQAITRGPAKAFSLKKVGALKKGYVADMVLWDGDPFELSSRVTKLFLRGKEYPLIDRQLQLARRYLNSPSP